MVAARQFVINECKAITTEKEMIMEHGTFAEGLSGAVASGLGKVRYLN